MKQYVIKIEIEGMKFNQAISDEDDLILLKTVLDKIYSSAKKVSDGNKPTQPACEHDWDDQLVHWQCRKCGSLK